MGAFNGSVLVTGISTSWIDGEAMLEEDTTDVRVAVELTPLINVDIPVATTTITREIFLKIITNGIEGCCL